MRTGAQAMDPEPLPPLSAPVLGQLLLMQSVLGNLPDEQSILSFVCRGLRDLPGVTDARFVAAAGESAARSPPRFPLVIGSSNWGELSVTVCDPSAFAPYEAYLKNFCFMLAVVIEERRQRRLNEQHSAQLEQRVAERTANLEAASQALAASRLQALQMMRDAVAARERAEQTTAELQREAAERQRAEEALRDGERRFRSVLETVSLIGVMLDRHGKITLCNDFVLELTGWKREEVMGQDWFELFLPPEIRAYIQAEIFLKSIATGEIPAHFENEIVTRGGERRLVAWNNTTLRDPSGTVVGVASIGEDITARKRAEVALRETEAKQRAMIANIADVIAVIDQDGFNRYQSPNIERWFGWRPEEVVGASTWEKVHPEDLERTQKAFGALLHEPSSTTTAECRYRCKDGRYKWIEFTAVNRLHDADIRGVLLNYRDVTERKRAEEENQKLQDQLIQAQKMESVGRLAGGVAHDFNNMLSVILGNAELALEQVDPAQPIHAELQEILATTQRSADLTRQLLAFARKQTVAPRVLDLNQTVAGMLKMLRRLIGEDIDLRWRPTAELWPVKIDPAQIDQILANLAVNARDAIVGVGAVTIETEKAALDAAACANHADRVPGDYVVLAVSDNGSGMTQETLAHIFEPFFTTKPVGKGTGLGLATVYGIVRQNQGFIEVHSERAVGTTFRIYLPRHLGKPVVVSPEDNQGGAPGGLETVLLVEDEPALLRVTKAVLERLGYTVLTAATPGEAIHLAAEHSGRIDLLITDVVMPEMNGRDLAKRLLSCYPNLKRLFMSGYTASVIAPHALVDEGVNLIQKPFSLKDLAIKVRQALSED